MLLALIGLFANQHALVQTQAVNLFAIRSEIAAGEDHEFEEADRGNLRGGLQEKVNPFERAEME